MKKVIAIPGAPAPIGPYSQAVHHGNQLFVSGQIGLNPHTGEWVNDSIESETQQVMDNINALIEAAGFTKDDIVKCSIFLKDMGDFEAVNGVYAAFFAPPFPARETVQVSVLPKDVNVEISVIACK